jgi:hypothetical protein
VLDFQKSTLAAEHMRELDALKLTDFGVKQSDIAQLYMISRSILKSRHYPIHCGMSAFGMRAKVDCGLSEVPLKTQTACRLRLCRLRLPLFMIARAGKAAA